MPVQELMEVTINSPVLKAEYESSFQDEIRFVIVGRTGSGISSLGNNLLNSAHYFTSKRSPQSVTKICRRGEALRDGQKICLVETPGLYYTSFSEDYVKQEIAKSLSMVTPGPHAMLYVCRVGRHSEEEIKSLKVYSDIFGQDVHKYTVVVFSGKDYVNDDDMYHWADNLPPAFKSFINRCNGRQIFVNTQLYGHEGNKQWHELLSIVHPMVYKNVPHYFYKNATLNNIVWKSILRQAFKHKKSLALSFALIVLLGLRAFYSYSNLTNQ